VRKQSSRLQRTRRRRNPANVGRKVPPGVILRTVTTSICVCGTDSIDVRTLHADPSQDPLRVPVDLIAELPERLREAQALFDKTGGVHAAGLLKVDGASPELLCLREVVGRHNAVDKVVGWALRQDLLPLSGTVLQVSGWASFELVQKAALAGIPVLSAVSVTFKPGRRPRCRNRSALDWIQQAAQLDCLRRPRKANPSAHCELRAARKTMPRFDFVLAGSTSPPSPWRGRRRR